MGRFLIFFSYFGTRYRGLQQQTGVLLRGKPIKTVASVLEEALASLKPANEISLTLSSRTDKGVHALKNACHVDLVYPKEGLEYHPDVITSVMNNYLDDRDEDIRILRAQHVSSMFHSRMFARSRKYIYRLGYMNDDRQQEENLSINKDALKQMKHIIGSTSKALKLPLGNKLSALDGSKVHLLKSPLDKDKLMSAAEMMSGIHNFLSFTAARREDAVYQPSPVKMLAIGLKRGKPLSYQWQKRDLDYLDKTEFWDIHIEAKSFLYRQVRRLVGAMILVAQNRITLAELRDVLENPRRQFPFSHYMTTKETGLFLGSVNYYPKDLQFDTSNVRYASDLNTSSTISSADDQQELLQQQLTSEQPGVLSQTTNLSSSNSAENFNTAIASHGDSSEKNSLDLRIVDSLSVETGSLKLDLIKDKIDNLSDGENSENEPVVEDESDEDEIVPSKSSPG